MAHAPPNDVANVARADEDRPRPASAARHYALPTWCFRMARIAERRKGSSR